MDRSNNTSNASNNNNNNNNNNTSNPRPLRNPSSGHVSSSLAPAWPFNPAETALIRAGYNPAYNPADKANSTPTPTPTSTSTSTTQSIQQVRMAEPRARAPRHKGQMNFPTELRLLLLAYGDPSPHPSYPSEPLPETVRVLDEIVTDYILEMCHSAAQCAGYARRQKIKVDDFRFALRRDENKLGRVQELLRMERELKEARKAFDQNDDQVAAAAAAGKKGLTTGGPGGGAGEGGSVDGGKKGKGKGKRAAPGAAGSGGRRGSDATEGTSKKRKVVG